MSFEIKEPAVAYPSRSIEDFFLETENSNERYEFLDGEWLLMAHTTQAHAEIAGNLNSYLKSNLKGRGCKSFQESIYLRIKNNNILRLPDVVVTCEADDISPKARFIDNPTIIIEVLSESTELTDRSIKWQQYRQIPSLRYYLMVSQKEPLVEVFGRPHAQSLFYFESFEGIEATVDLREMGLKIPMQEIYDGIVFETIAELP